MNDKTQMALQMLAEKLGTTTQYLWHVLIKQARYDFYINIIQSVFMTLFIFSTIKLHLFLIKGYKEDNSIYNNYDLSAVIPMVFTGLISCYLILCFLTGLDTIVTSICNPEYWALKQILKTIHR